MLLINKMLSLDSDACTNQKHKPVYLKARTLNCYSDCYNNDKFITVQPELNKLVTGKFAKYVCLSTQANHDSSRDSESLLQSRTLESS